MAERKQPLLSFAAFLTTLVGWLAICLLCQLSPYLGLQNVDNNVLIKDLLINQFFFLSRRKHVLMLLWKTGGYL